MKNALLTTDQVASLINAGETLLLAGSEEALSVLPRGKWIGGTSVYFLTESGGIVDRERVFCTRISEAVDANTRILSAEELPRLSEGRYKQGFSAILIPAFCEAHTAFAMEGSRYPGVFEQPLMGWIAGVHLDEIGTRKPKVFDGATGAAHEEGAAMLYVQLPPARPARLDIVNIFSQGDEMVVTFDKNGFEARRAVVNGEAVNLAEYLVERRIDTRLPFVANYAGALINVSVQEVDEEEGVVRFYAPVVKGVEYRLALELENYADAFGARLRGQGADDFSCNCILNYLYGELEGRRAGACVGPATFGEIAYMLLNQTLVRMHVDGAA
ncbi:DUF6976 family protein [Rhodovulum sp. DZ06]|uniref:DUF6976 family protein n=1 Tax=Rhodovulum sp. DZ06 TaxID=3425126 RepID=UPI003D332E45